MSERAKHRKPRATKGKRLVYLSICFLRRGLSRAFAPPPASNEFACKGICAATTKNAELGVSLSRLAPFPFFKTDHANGFPVPPLFVLPFQLDRLANFSQIHLSLFLIVSYLRASSKYPIPSLVAMTSIYLSNFCSLFFWGGRGKYVFMTLLKRIKIVEVSPPPFPSRKWLTPGGFFFFFCY